MNRNYSIALQYVQQHYYQLFQCATHVVLVPADAMPAGQLGQCSRDNYIAIADLPLAVVDFVDTLVHELVHAKQNRNHAVMTDLQREETAYAAGKLAATVYMRRATEQFNNNRRRP